MQRRGKQRPFVPPSQFLVPQHGSVMPIPPAVPALPQLPAYITPPLTSDPVVLCSPPRGRQWAGSAS